MAQKKKKLRKSKKSSGPKFRPMPGKLINGLEEADRLMTSKKWGEAEIILLGLYRRYPNHPAVLELLTNLKYDQKDMQGFLLYTYKLSKLTPNDADVRLNLAGAYMMNVYPILALESYRQFVAKYPDHPEINRAHEALEILESTVPDMLRHFEMPGEDAMQIGTESDRIRMLLETGQTNEAKVVAKKFLQKQPDFAPVINNLSMVEFAEGRVEEAIAAAKHTLSIDPDNFQALANITRFLYLNGQTDEALQYATQLKAATSPMSDIYVKKAEAFAYLGDDEAVLEVFNEAEKANAIEDNAFLYHLAAVAILRQNNEKDAKNYWKKSVKINPNFQLAQNNLVELNMPVGQRHAPWPFPLDNWIARETLIELARMMEAAERNRSETAMKRAITRFFDKYPHINACIPMLFDRGDPQGRELAFRIADAAQTPQLLEAMRDFALGRRGPDDMRHQAAQIVSQAGLLPKTVNLWINGEQQELQLIGFEIYDEPHTYGHNPKVLDLIQQAMDLLYDGNPDKAEELMLQALALEPDAPDILNNLGAIYGAQKRHKETEEIIHRLYEEHPDYFFGIIGMARIYIKEKQLDNAEELLKPLIQKDRMHISEFKALCISHIQLELARNKPEIANTWLAMWENADPDDPDIDHWNMQIRLSDNPLMKAKKLFGF